MSWIVTVSMLVSPWLWQDAASLPSPAFRTVFTVQFEPRGELAIARRVYRTRTNCTLYVFPECGADEPVSGIEVAVYLTFRRLRG